MRTLLLFFAIVIFSSQSTIASSLISPDGRIAIPLDDFSPGFVLPKEVFHFKLGQDMALQCHPLDTANQYLCFFVGVK